VSGPLRYDASIIRMTLPAKFVWTRTCRILAAFLIAGMSASWFTPAFGEKIFFAYPSPSTSFLPLVVAQKKGFFNDENIQLELVNVRPAITIAGMVTGQIDYTTILGTPIGARMRGAPVVIVGIFTDKPMDFLVGAKGKRSAKDLHGQAVGISALGSATHFLTMRLLNAIGLQADRDVTIRAVGDEGLRLQALEAGLIQAALLGSQGVIQGRQRGFEVVVAAADVIENLPLGGVTTTLKKVKENPGQVRRVLRAGVRGLRYVHENRMGTIEVIQSWFKLDRNTASATYDLAIKSHSHDGEVSEKGIALGMELAKATGKIDKEISPSDMVDFSILREVKKELAWP
jgi:NitT/TauT family transport system substrate-binding protein